MVIGRQPLGDVWVVNPTTQFDSNGKRISADESHYLINLNLTTNIQNARYLKRTYVQKLKYYRARAVKVIYYTLLKKCVVHNFTNMTVLLGSGVMTFHFSSICKKYGGCSIPVAIGDPQTGKSTGVKATLSLCGSQESGYYVKGTNAFFLD